jgi:hypothetical protein
MVQPKYNPEEALQRIKLMMEYDSSMTLSENLVTVNKIIKEQSDCPNNIPYQDVRDKAEDAGQRAFNMFAPFQRMAKGEQRARFLFDTIKEVIGKNTYDDIEEKCVPAKDVFDKFFKKASESLFGFTSGRNVSQMLSDIVNDDYTKEEYPEAIRILTKAKSIWDKGVTQTPPVPDPNKPDPNKPDPNKPDPNKPDPNKPTPRYRNCDNEPKYTKGCRTRPEGPIGQVQACLGGLVQDGKFWDKTEAKLKEKTGRTEFTISDIAKICEKTNEVPEISGEAPPDVDGSNSDF